MTSKKDKRRIKRQRARKRPRKLELFVEGLNDDQAESMIDLLISFVESHDGTMGGGFVPLTKKEREGLE